MIELPETWQNSSWWNFGSLSEIADYLRIRYRVHETDSEALVGLALEVDEMPHDLLVQLVVHFTEKEDKAND